MPAFSQVQLLDGATTPVTRNFDPHTLIGRESKWADRSGGITVGYPTLTTQSLMADKTTNMNKVRTIIKLPVLEVASGATGEGIVPAPRKAYDLTFDGVFILPERCTLQDRKHLRALVKNLLANSLITALVENQESVY